MSDLDNMEAGPEMDRIIAEVVMKWTRRQWGTDPETYGAPIYEWRDASGHRAWATAWFNEVAWSPSTNIAHAWDVVDLLRKQGVGITVRTPGVYASADFGPTDKFSVLMQGRYPAGWFRQHGQDTDSVEVAICRAAIKAVASKILAETPVEIPEKPPGNPSPGQETAAAKP
jgi:hypothetical protein